MVSDPRRSYFPRRAYRNRLFQRQMSRILLSVINSIVYVTILCCNWTDQEISEVLRSDILLKMHVNTENEYEEALTMRPDPQTGQMLR
jgi:hypothetical protein